MINLMASDIMNQFLADFRETNAFTAECLGESRKVRGS